ncbi:hypothetical protein HR11_00190 [Porphyromonas macacae]|uniref:Putative beta-lactamase-inhibitor-like PepSY-like domain-containing protein n=1 Tax=Porphyromonas macacae TaxID=28115 RepID=A0A0A2EAH9_9PORP|nr:PepSY-like domain-containing protein [Porphyromonas macacae]KGN74475.1 hypothetical protein HQ47_05440 [Porphyromonas macacae]KGO00353.1 hypothetical protein HR11_00190 [Porphyromonas macacae]
MRLKLFLIFALFFSRSLFSSGETVYAKDNTLRPLQVNELPRIVRDFIHSYFAEKDISFIKSEGTMIFKKYAVYFVDGSKVEFTRNGKWEKVDCIKKAVPLGIVPSQIIAYMERHYPHSSIVEIYRDRRGYEVELNNDVEIKFDSAFNIKEYDD